MLVKYSHDGACTLKGAEGEGSLSSSLIKIMFLSKEKVKLLSSKDLGSLTSRFLFCNETHYRGEYRLTSLDNPFLVVFCQRKVKQLAKMLTP